MKSFSKIAVCLLCLVTLTNVNTHAQNSFPTSGNVGIGTQNPNALLHIVGGGLTLGTGAVSQNTDGSFSFGNVAASYTPTTSNWTTTGSTMILSAQSYSTMAFHHSGMRVDFIRVGNGTIQLGYNGGWGEPNIGLPGGGVWNSAGMLGIGTTAPQATVEAKALSSWDVATMLRITNNATDYGRSNLVLTGRFQDNNDAWSFGSSARNSIVFAQNASTSGQNIGATGTEQFSIQLEGNSNSLGFMSKTNASVPMLTLAQNGFVGIGTLTPKEQLSVNGNIRAKQVKIEITNWPDYVFEDNYKNLSLDDLAKFIKDKHHLPGVPTAQDVKAHGLNVGEANTILLQKIEELTLIIIDQKKQIDIQNRDNLRRFADLEKKIALLVK